LGVWLGPMRMVITLPFDASQGTEHKWFFSSGLSGSAKWGTAGRPWSEANAKTAKQAKKDAYFPPRKYAIKA